MTFRPQYSNLPADSIASPCISVCKMNPVTGLCDGCQRTIDEIAHWSLLDEHEKRAVLVQLPARRAAA